MIKPQNKIIAHATTAQQAKELKALTATLKEQAAQIQKVSDRLEHLKPTKKDLMISKIISGAACPRELASDPKSFSNCPDLHGGVPDLPGVTRPKGKACIARLGFGRIRARQQPDSESVGEPNLAL